MNGLDVDRKVFQRYAAYVQQFDSLLPTLTVRETLMYSADLTLPSRVPQSEKDLIVRLSCACVCCVFMRT